MEDDMKLEFSNNPADYNRVLCMVCRAKIKVGLLCISSTDSQLSVQVHHMKKHLLNHDGLTIGQYKETYGQDWVYVKKYHHHCGICQQPLLFDLETLYHHLARWAVTQCVGCQLFFCLSNHYVKVKEYIDLYIGPIGSLSSSSRYSKLFF